jgi:hypothetical protein
MMERMGWVRMRAGTSFLGNVNYLSHWKSVWRFLQKLKVEPLYNPATSLLELQTYIYTHVYCDTIHNRQSMEPV